MIRLPFALRALRSFGGTVLASALFGSMAVGCVAEEESFDVTIPFAAFVGDEPFACGTTFDGVGTSQSTINPRDFRFYVHDVVAITASGEHTITLTDGDFQRGTTALLDFEDGTDACETGSPDLHTAIEGTMNVDEAVEGVAFNIGISPDENHLDAATAEPPFNIPGMWWSWAGGYKFMKVDLFAGDDESAVFFHHGATSCQGTPDTGFSCAFRNERRVELDLADDDVVAVDLAALYAGIDLAAPLAENDGIKGCMAFGGDPECPPMFGSLGLAFEGNDVVDAAPTFTVRGAL